jgi:hypothetical protein
VPAAFLANYTAALGFLERLEQVCVLQGSPLQQLLRRASRCARTLQRSTCSVARLRAIAL